MMIPRIEAAAAGMGRSVGFGRAGGFDRAWRRALERRVRRAARAMGCTREQLQGLTLRVVDDPTMRVLKAEHFGLDEATDVLSFPAGEPLPGEDPEEAPFGELVLNLDAVRRQAARPGPAGWLDEATQLLVHGLAHLLGHDHDQRARARRMLARERRGCRALGLPCDRPYGGSR